MTTITGEVLSPTHLGELNASAISDDQIAARKYQTIINPKALPLQFTGGQRKLSGILIPVASTTGDIVAWQVKPDSPRTIEGKKAKYEFARDGRVCLDVPTAARPYLLNPGADLWITEGAKKVDSAVSNGIPCTIGVMGVWMWQQGGLMLPDWRDIELRGRVCIVAFDSDVMEKSSVHKALRELSASLTYRGAIVRYCLMPDLPDGAKCGLDDWFASGKLRAGLEALIVDFLPSGEAEWQNPIPFDDPTGPPFPLDALPDTMREYVVAVAVDTGAPVDLVAWCALATIGAATRGRFVMSPKATWREPVHILTAQIVASGGGKSPAYNAITAPLKAWDAQQAARGREALGLWKLTGKRLAAQEKQAQREADKIGPGQQDKRLALEAVQQDILAHEQERPYAKHIVVNDITPQAIWKFLHRQEGSGAAFSAEGEFFRNVNRYGDAPVWEPVLKGFSGDGHETRRAGDEDDDGRLIPRPIFALSLALQPQVMEDLGQVRGFRELGVLARLLMVFPRAVPERGSLSTSVPDDLQDWWDDRILKIANGTHGITYAPETLPMSPDALDVFEDEYRWYPQAVAAGVFLDMEEWSRKYRGQVLRVAGLLHIVEADDPVKTPVSAGNMRRATTIMRNAIDHARIGHGIVLGLGTQSHERYVLNIIDALLDGNPTAPITSADIYDRVRGRYIFRKAERVTTILQTLEEHRFIRLERRDGPGPRTYVIFRNPKGVPCEDAELPPRSGISTPDAGHDHVIPHLRRHPPSPETQEPTLLQPAPVTLDELDPLDRADVEDVAAELRAGGAPAIATWRADLERNHALSDHEQRLGMLAVELASEQAAA